MATAAKPDLAAPAHQETFEEMEARLLAGAQQRINADVAEAMRLGLIDAEGNLLFDDLPEDMQPGAKRDFGG
jgi:hypothetical protein